MTPLCRRTFFKTLRGHRSQNAAAPGHPHFLWFASGDKKLALALRSIISDPRNEIFLSVVSLWEMIIKYHLGHLPLPQPPEVYVPIQRKRLRISSLAVDEGSVFQVAKLPPLHRDPLLPDCPCLVGRVLFRYLAQATFSGAKIVLNPRTDSERFVPARALHIILDD